MSKYWRGKLLNSETLSLNRKILLISGLASLNKCFSSKKLYKKCKKNWIIILSRWIRCRRQFLSFKTSYKLTTTINRINKVSVPSSNRNKGWTQALKGNHFLTHRSQFSTHHNKFSSLKSLYKYNSNQLDKRLHKEPKLQWEMDV